MPTPLQELNTRLDELTENAEFVALAAKLRPRLGLAIAWDADKEVIDLARKFMNSKGSQPESLYGAVFVRVLAALERYVRGAIDYVVHQRAESTHSYEEISRGLGLRNRVLTGRLLGALDNATEEESIVSDALVTNLATCVGVNHKFALNASVFSDEVTGSSPSTLERALRHVEIEDWWDDVGRDPVLGTLLGVKKTRVTGDRAKERLKELWRWRNHIAHGGPEELALSESDLQESIRFVRDFAGALDKCIDARLRRYKR